MHKVHSVQSLRAAVSAARRLNKTIGFVPTMGNLHDGHLSLIKDAKILSDFVVVSIYVNPTQFGENEDFDEYPSTPEKDARELAEAGADLLFLPDEKTMYPGRIERQTQVSVPHISDLYCGLDRPEHFYGVTTVVCRFFHMVQPDVAIFGKKDYQQISIIRKMVDDLAFPLTVKGVETVRSDKGLALSSRNQYLSSSEMAMAHHLYRELNKLAGRITSLSLALEKEKLEKESLEKESAEKESICKKSLKQVSFRKMEKESEAKLAEHGFVPQYIKICRQSDLAEANESDKKLVILAAAVLGKTRLIDNFEIDLTII